MWYINFKPLKGKDVIRRKIPQSFQNNKRKEENGNKGKKRYPSVGCLPSQD